MNQGEAVYGMPDKAYREHVGINISLLNKLYKSPAHCLHSMCNPTEPTKDMIFGTRVHHALFQRETFRDKYVIAPEKPQYDARTKEGKEIKAAYDAIFEEFESSLTRDQEIVTVDDLKMIEDCVRTVEKHPKVEQLLEKITQTEISLFWRDSDTVMRKGRIDAYAPDLEAIVDLKTTFDASPEKWIRTCYDRGYHRQAGWYQEGANKCGLSAKRFFHIVVESSEPWATSVFLLRPELVELGQEQNKKLIKDFLSYQGDGHWPPYSEELLELGIPSWAIKQTMETA